MKTDNHPLAGSDDSAPIIIPSSAVRSLFTPRPDGDEVNPVLPAPDADPLANIAEGRRQLDRYKTKLALEKCATKAATAEASR